MLRPKKILFLITVLCCLCTLGCRDDASYLIENNSQKLLVMSELIPGEQVTVEVSSTIPLLNNYGYLEIDDNTVVNLSSPSNENVYTLNYERRGEMDHIAVFTLDPSFDVVPGEYYTVSVSPPFEDVNGVEAITKIPPAPKFEFIEMVNFDGVKNPNNPKSRLYTYDVQLGVERDPEDLESTRFYHIIPMRREVEIDQGSNVLPFYTNIFYHHENYYFTSGAKACFPLKDLYGFLVDMEDLDQDEIIQATFTSLEELEVNNYEHKYLHFLIYSVTEEYYAYHKAVTNAISANSFNAEEVVLDRSNVRNGRGLVSGMNVRLDSTRVKN